MVNNNPPSPVSAQLQTGDLYIFAGGGLKHNAFVVPSPVSPELQTGDL